MATEPPELATEPPELATNAPKEEFATAAPESTSPLCATSESLLRPATSLWLEYMMSGKKLPLHIKLRHAMLLHCMKLVLLYRFLSQNC